VQRTSGLARGRVLGVNLLGALDALLEEDLREAVGLQSVLSSAVMRSRPLLTSCWAIAARLQNATVTSSEVSFFASICSMSSVAGVSVISISLGVSTPQVLGTSITSLTLGSTLMRHAAGIVASRCACLAADTAFQSLVVATVIVSSVNS